MSTTNRAIRCNVTNEIVFYETTIIIKLIYRLTCINLFRILLCFWFSVSLLSMRLGVFRVRLHEE